MASVDLKPGRLVDVFSLHEQVWPTRDWVSRYERTICVVGILPNAVVYKSLKKPIHWPSNPMRTVLLREAEWLISAGYWEPIARVHLYPWVEHAGAWKEFEFGRWWKRATSAEKRKAGFKV